VYVCGGAGGSNLPQRAGLLRYSLSDIRDHPLWAMGFSNGELMPILV